MNIFFPKRFYPNCPTHKQLKHKCCLFPRLLQPGDVSFAIDNRQTAYFFFLIYHPFGFHPFDLLIEVV